MIPKWFIWFCVALGSTAGAYIPMLWGAGLMSFSSVLLSAVGGIFGIWAAIKIGNSF